MGKGGERGHLLFLRLAIFILFYHFMSLLLLLIKSTCKQSSMLVLILENRERCQVMTKIGLSCAKFEFEQFTKIEGHLSKDYYVDLRSIPQVKGHTLFAFNFRLLPIPACLSASLHKRSSTLPQMIPPQLETPPGASYAGSSLFAYLRNPEIFILKQMFESGATASVRRRVSPSPKYNNVKFQNMFSAGASSLRSWQQMNENINEVRFGPGRE